MTSAIVIGSGAGGSAAALELVRAGFDVVVLEKGRNLLPGLGGPGPVGSLFGNDEVKAGRFFEDQDVVLEPRTSRTRAEANQGVARSFERKGIETFQIVEKGDPVEAILKTARFHGADLIAMTTHGRSGIGRLVTGSVTEQVLRRVPVPLLVVRAAAPAKARRRPAETKRK